MSRVASYNKYIHGEKAYMTGDIQGAFNSYQQAIKECLKNERVDVRLPISPSQLPPVFPEEALANYWMNFAGFIKDRNLGLTEESHPEAWKLLKSFSINSSHQHHQFKTPHQKFLLKMLQIQANFCIGLLAWDKRDRATAAKRYQEALELADTEPSVCHGVQAGAKHLTLMMQTDIAEMRGNYEQLKKNDQLNSMLAGAKGDRKEIVTVPNARVVDGQLVGEEDVMVATHSCANCGKREAKGMKQCARCKQVYYCGKECQSQNWKSHKRNCVSISK